MSRKDKSQKQADSPVGSVDIMEASDIDNGGKARKDWKFWILHILVAAWMIFIFYMSAQPGDTSGEISGSVSHLFMKIWNVIFFRGWSEAEVLQMAEIWDYPIRKLAHMTEFGILAALVYWMLGRYPYYQAQRGVPQCAVLQYATRKCLKKRYLWAWMSAVIYATTDELHQLFVPDRAGLFTDVCIDACGAAIGLAIIWIMTRLSIR